MTTSKIKKIREELQKKNFQGILISKWDEFRSEFVDPYDDYLNWTTKFTGSYGASYISKDHAIIFVDGRYTSQAKSECRGFKVIDIKQMKSWIKENTQGQVVFDSWCWSEKEIAELEQQVGDVLGVEAPEGDLVDL